jgi:predicted heme/steroid binding protein
LELVSQEVPELTDRNHSDAGISLIRLLARQSDLLNFYADKIFSEGFLETAKMRQSVIDLATLVDCKLKLVSPASCTIKVSKKPDYRFNGSSPREVTVEQYSVFSRTDGVTYINLDPIIMDISTDDVTFNIYQLEMHKIQIGPGDFEYIYPYKRLRYNLGANVVRDFIYVYEPISGIYWQYVDSFYRSLPNDKHFTLELYAEKYNGENDTVFLSVGDGLYGTDVIPNVLEVTFFTTSGSAGNCGTDVITTPPHSTLLTCTNITGATGGAEVESTEDFRARVPQLVRTQRRAIVESDYDALIRSIEGVADCEAVSRSSNISWPYMYVFIYVLPNGGGDISNYLRQKIRKVCKSWGHMGDWDNRYVILDPIVNTVDIKLRVGKKEEINEYALKTKILTVLNKFFLPENRKLGKGLNLGEIHKAVGNIYEIDWLEVLNPSSSYDRIPGYTYVLGKVDIEYVS